MRLSPGQQALLLSVLLHSAALAGLAKMGGAALPGLNPSNEPMVVWLHDNHDAATALIEPATLARAPVLRAERSVISPQRPASTSSQDLEPRPSETIAKPSDTAPEPAELALSSHTPPSATAASAEQSVADSASPLTIPTQSDNATATTVASAAATAPAPDLLSMSAQADRRARPDHGRNPPPVYPRLLREQGIEGTVLVRAAVGPDGMAQAVELAASSGHRLLDQAALRAVQRWRFIPARLNDTPVASVVEFPVSFQLKDTQDPQPEPPSYQANAGA
jgi:protein TonB